MRIRRASTVLTTALLGLVALVAAPGAAALEVAPDASAERARPTYYVALGDSLSQGYQPGQGDTDQGYVDALHATLAEQRPGLQLVKLGCSGETVVTMVHGGICSYDEGSQLAAAKQFLADHRGEVAYVTIDIGANDVARCATGGTIDQVCAQAGLATVAETLPTIVKELRRAGGTKPTYAGMTYYDPFLAAWLLGPAGQEVARQSVVLTDALNGIERAAYERRGFAVAPVDVAFRTGDFDTQVTLPVIGTVPVNVATICTLTFMCLVADIHATVDGYRLIAATFAEVMPPPRF